jgi:Mg/Co/Ni transporter MgtE
VVAAVGSVLGGILGLIPVFGLVRLIYQTGGFPQPTFEVPWAPMLALVVGVPLFAFVMAALTTRSEIPMVQRMS